MQTIASGYFPKTKSLVGKPMYSYGDSPTLLWIHPAYAEDYERVVSAPESPSLLERFEFEQARALSSQHLSASFYGGSEGVTFRDPFSLAFLKNRTIEIHGVVTPKMAKDVRTKAQLIVAAMAKYKIENPTVKFVIHSPGGDILSMMSILDTMDMLKNTKINGKEIIVATYMDGMAASAASFMLANGTKGHRYMNPRAQIMIHQPSSWAGGQVTDMEIGNKLTQEFKSWGHTFFKEHTNVDDTWIKQVMERDYWMKIDEAIERGFVDKPHTEFDVGDLEGIDLNLVFKSSSAIEEEDPGGCCPCS